MKRSIGVTMMSTLFILGGVLTLSVPGLVHWLSTSPEVPAELQAQFRNAISPVQMAFALFVGAAGLIGGVGLLLLKPWARALVLALAGLSLVQGSVGLVSTATRPGVWQQPGTGLSALLAATFIFGWNGLVLWWFLHPSVKAQFDRRQSADSA